MSFSEVLKQAELAREEQDKFAQAQEQKRAAELQLWRDRLERWRKPSVDADDGFELPPDHFGSFVNPDINPDEYMSLPQAAKELGMHPTSIGNYIKNEKISAIEYQPPGKRVCWLIHKDEVERLRPMGRPSSKNPIYPKGYMGIREAADKFDIPYHTLFGVIRSNKIAAQKYGNLWIVKEEAVREWMQNKRGFRVKSNGK